MVLSLSIVVETSFKLTAFNLGFKHYIGVKQKTTNTNRHTNTNTSNVIVPVDVLHGIKEKPFLFILCAFYQKFQCANY